MTFLAKPIDEAMRDVRRMDWLVSKVVEVRNPARYGSHHMFTSQTLSDVEDEQHRSSLREQIDVALQSAQEKKS